MVNLAIVGSKPFDSQCDMFLRCNVRGNCDTCPHSTFRCSKSFIMDFLRLIISITTLVTHCLPTEPLICRGFLTGKPISARIAKANVNRAF